MSVRVSHTFSLQQTGATLRHNLITEWQVALNSLSSVVDDDVAAVQRHRKWTQRMATMNSCHVGAIILDCLKDPDISIRQRALELTYQLVDANNIVELVRELLN